MKLKAVTMTSQVVMSANPSLLNFCNEFNLASFATKVWHWIVAVVIYLSVRGQNLSIFLSFQGCHFGLFSCGFKLPAAEEIFLYM